MALGDIKLFREPVFGGNGSVTHQVAASATLINAGEPVTKALGQQYVVPMATNKPVVATDIFIGIAATTSTNTASADGTVEVIPFIPGTTYIVSPKVAATWNTQAKYNALVGARVLMDLTSGVYTILATDGATYGFVVEPLDVVKFPGKVAFTVRAGAMYTA